MFSNIVAHVSGVFISEDPGAFVSRRVPEAVVEFAGFVGDRHAGLTRESGGGTPWYPRNTIVSNPRSVTIVSEEELSQIARAMNIPHVLPEWLCANIVVRGVRHLTQLPPTSTLLFPDGTGIVVYKENNPCSGPGKIIQSQFPQVEGLTEGFTKHAMGLRGLLAWVERPGIVREGDDVRIELAKQVLYSY